MDKIQAKFRDVEANSKRRQAKLESKRRFECTFPGCGRHYSRAEHLYRHQLNHNPKEIFKCNHPGCTRIFVRQDLCIRHQDRHTNRDRHGSTVGSTIGDNVRDQAVPLETSNRTRRSTESTTPEIDVPDPSSPNFQRSNIGTQSSHSFLLPRASDGSKNESELLRSPEKGLDWYQMPSQSTQGDMQQPSKPFYAVQNNENMMQDSASSAGRNPNSAGINHRGSMSFSQTPRTSAGQSVDNQVQDLFHSPSSNFHQTTAAVDRQVHGNPATGASGDTSMVQFAVPSMGDHNYEESPASVRDEFTTWLFDEYSLMRTGPFNLNTQSIGLVGASDNFGTQINATYFGDSPLNHHFPDIMMQSPLEVTNQIQSTSADGGLLSELKRQSILSHIEFRFAQGDNSAVRNLREEIFQGNRDADDHVLSMRSMQQYIASYWHHVHAQLPILHQPTFSPEKVHENLLLAVMAVGASYLEKAHGKQFVDSASRFATFIVWHLRWQVFMNSDFRPPAKLWVFQTLVLLEVYETFCATRGLHERAHIHYATTITLMRRGTALIDDSLQTLSSVDRTPTTPEQWWNRWVTAEATRRVAFAAFFLDAVHASMFNHRASMVVHEVRLPLPCDDALWAATSADEVARVEASLHANGIKQTTFLDGLKKTLTGRKVRTNTFGRMILMAGLLSVSWHMYQRDLQISSLGVSTSMGVPDGWKEPLSKAFEFWHKDFEESVSHMQSAILPWQRLDSDLNGFTTRRIAIVLHHLSHMSMHVDTLECQIFTGARRLFGRPISDIEHERVKTSIHHWAKSPGARTAVYHALQFLKAVLIVNSNGEIKLYNAREDHVLLQSWVLYYASLTVWSYGFAIDGVLRPFPAQLLPSGTHVDQRGWEIEKDALVRNAQSYLQTIGTVSSPQELETIKSGRNNVVGLLRLVELAFYDSTWELLHEAADRLKQAVKLLEG